MTDTQREESEAGKFSLWVHVKNWISDYLKATDIDIDGNKYISTNVKNLPTNYPDSAANVNLLMLLTELQQKLETTDLNIDISKNAGVNVKTITEEIPTAATKNNPYYSFAYDGDGRLQCIYQTIGVTQWRKIIIYSSGRISSIGAWSIFP